MTHHQLYQGRHHTSYKKTLLSSPVLAFLLGAVGIFVVLLLFSERGSSMQAQKLASHISAAEAKAEAKVDGINHEPQGKEPASVPSVVLPPQDISQVQPADAYLSLTFDDGTTPELTDRLLDGLAARGVHATFFVVGSRAEKQTQTLQRMHKDGHEIGNHSTNHPMQKLSGIPIEQVREEVRQCSDTIERATGKRPCVMRPVGGGVNENVKAVAREQQMALVNWVIDTEDWRLRDVKHISDVIVEQAYDGGIVLMHDLYPETVEGVLDGIDRLQAQTDKRFGFVTVSELAALRGVPLHTGTLYYQMNANTAEQIANGSYQPVEYA